MLIIEFGGKYMKKRGIKLLLSLILSILSFGLYLSPVFATGISYKFDEPVKKKLEEFFRMHEQIAFETQYNPDVNLRTWKRDVCNYILELKLNNGYKVAGEFFRNLAIIIDEEQIRERAMRVTYNYIDFSVQVSSTELAGFFYEEGRRFVVLTI